jgi:hypothetical protein
MLNFNHRWTQMDADWGKFTEANEDNEARTGEAEDGHFETLNFNHSSLLPLERDSPRQGWTQPGRAGTKRANHGWHG